MTISLQASWPHDSFTRFPCKPIPDVVKTIEEIAAETLAKKRAKKARKITALQPLDEHGSAAQTGLPK
jgi:hypothetical protein